MVPLVSATPVRNVRRRSMMLRTVNTPTLTMSTGWIKSSCKLPTFSTREVLLIPSPVMSCVWVVETVMMLVRRRTQWRDILSILGRGSVLSSENRILLRKDLLTNVTKLNYYEVKHFDLKLQMVKLPINRFPAISRSFLYFNFSKTILYKILIF